MHVRVVGVGKVRESYLQEGIKDYCTRIQPYFPISLHDVAEERIPQKLTPAEKEALLEREGERLLSLTRGSGILVVLEVEGTSWRSEDLAAHLKSWILEGHTSVSFLIGGPLGIAPGVRKSARYALSLSRMTFPHQVVRLILLEQIYRAARICNGEPYHK